MIYALPLTCLRNCNARKSLVIVVDCSIILVVRKHHYYFCIYSNQCCIYLFDINLNENDDEEEKINNNSTCLFLLSFEPIVNLIAIKREKERKIIPSNWTWWWPSIKFTFDIFLLSYSYVIMRIVFFTHAEKWSISMIITH